MKDQFEGHPGGACSCPNRLIRPVPGSCSWANQLSGGQQQRVAIARAIVSEPRVLLADEPTGALDSRTTQEVMDIFTGLNEAGITIVMVTHEPDVAKQTRRIVWFKDGQVVHSHLTPSDIYRVAMEVS